MNCGPRTIIETSQTVPCPERSGLVKGLRYFAAPFLFPDSQNSNVIQRRSVLDLSAVAASIGRSPRSFEIPRVRSAAALRGHECVDHGSENVKDQWDRRRHCRWFKDHIHEDGRG